MYIALKCIIIGVFLCLLSPEIFGQVDEPCHPDTAKALVKEKAYTAAIEMYNCLLERGLEASCQAEVYYMLGTSHTSLSAYRTGIVNFRKALEILETVENHYLEAKAYSRMAYANSRLGNFEEAYSLQMKALKIAEAGNDQDNISRSVYHLGNYAQSIENYPQALDYYFQVKNMIEDTTVSRQYPVIIGAIGSVYVEMGALERGIEYLKRSADLSRENNDLSTLAYALGNLGEAHVKKGNFELAVDYIGTAIDRKRELKDSTGVVDSKLQLGYLWMDQKRYGRAEAILLEATQEATDLGTQMKLLECFKALKQLFSENGQFEKAYYFLDRYTTLKEKVLDQNILELIEEHNLIYETANKEAEIRRLKDIQAERDKNYQLKLFIGFFCILVLTAWIIWGYWVNRSLSRKNDSLAEFSKRLKQKNTDLEHFAHVASHDLKEPLRTISSFTTLLGKRYVQHLDDQARIYMNFIQSSVENMRILLDDLLNYARADNPVTEAAKIKSQTALQTALNNLNAQIEKKEANIWVNEVAFPEMEIVPSQLVQLFQNLIANALKFSNGEKPVVEVKCEPETGGYHRFSIKDNGIGIAPEDQKKIFEMFSRLNHEQVFKGSGIGLATCKKIVDQYGGRIWVESELGKGATFHFTLPDSQNEKSRTV